MASKKRKVSKEDKPVYSIRDMQALTGAAIDMAKDAEREAIANFVESYKIQVMDPYGRIVLVSGDTRQMAELIRARGKP